MVDVAFSAKSKKVRVSVAQYEMQGLVPKCDGCGAQVLDVEFERL